MPQFLYFIVTADILHTCSNSMCAVCVYQCMLIVLTRVFLEAMKICEEFIQYMYMQSSQLSLTHSVSISLVSLTAWCIHFLTLKLTPCGLIKIVKYLFKITIPVKVTCFVALVLTFTLTTSSNDILPLVAMEYCLASWISHCCLTHSDPNLNHYWQWSHSIAPTEVESLYVVHLELLGTMHMKVFFSFCIMLSACYVHIC